MARFKFTILSIGVLFALSQAGPSFAKSTLQGAEVPNTTGTTVIINPPTSGHPVRIRLVPIPRNVPQSAKDLENKKEPRTRPQVQTHS